MVAANQQCNETTFRRVNHQRFDGFLNGQLELLYQRGDGFGIRCINQTHLFARGGALNVAAQRCGQRFGFFDVSSVIRCVGEHDIVFAGVGQHVEFVRARAANRAVVSNHWAEVEAQACENTRIGVVHALVSLFERGFVQVEGVGIFHDELTRAHHAKARANLITEFGLNLVEVHRQLLVAGDLFAHQVSDDFFMSGAYAVIALVAIFQTQQFRAVLLPAARLLP